MPSNVFQMFCATTNFRLSKNNSRPNSYRLLPLDICAESNLQIYLHNGLSLPHCIVHVQTGRARGKYFSFTGEEIYCRGAFYTNNSIIYMEVTFRDIMTRLKACTQVLQALQANETFSQTGNLNWRVGGGGELCT